MILRWYRRANQYPFLLLLHVQSIIRLQYRPDGSVKTRTPCPHGAETRKGIREGVESEVFMNLYHKTAANTQ